MYEVLTGIQWGPADRVRVFRTYEECERYIRHMNLHRFEAISMLTQILVAIDQNQHELADKLEHDFDIWATKIKFGQDFKYMLDYFSPKRAARSCKKGFVFGENVFINQIFVDVFEDT